MQCVLRHSTKMSSPAVLARSCLRRCIRPQLSQLSRHATASPISQSPLRSSAQPALHLPLSSAVVRSFASATSPATTDAEDAISEAADDKAAVEHFLSSLPAGLADFAPKFTSWSHLIHCSSRQLKALGLSIKQRKALLQHTELYKARQRRGEMLTLLAQPSTAQQSAVEVQQSLYDISYAHVYGRQWKHAEEREAEHWWRQATEMNRMRKSFIRNQWNGVQVHTNPESIKALRNPELMKERLKAEIDKLRKQQADGSAETFDHLDLFEHQQLLDENERLDMKDAIMERLQDMEDDEETREAIREVILQQRQHSQLDTKDQTEAADEAEDEVEEADEEGATKLRAIDEGEAEEDEEEELNEQDDVDDDELELSQAERDARNPHFESSMSEEEKDDARLELEVDKVIFSADMMGAVAAEIEMEYEQMDTDMEEDEMEVDDSESEPIDELQSAAALRQLIASNSAESNTATDSVSGETVDTAAAEAEASTSSEVTAAEEETAQEETETASERVRKRRHQSASISKLFSYNGQKAEC